MTDKTMARFAGADAWIEQYFLNSPDDEREEFTPAELEDLARTHRALAEIRASKTPIVAARNDDYNTTLYVATDDMPHIVSSLTAYLSAHFGGFLAIFHPIFLAERNADGKLISLRGTGTRANLASGDTAAVGMPSLQLSEGAPEGSTVTIESWIAIRLTRYLGEDDLRLLEHEVRRVLDDVRACYTDLDGMVAAVFDIAQAMYELRGATLGHGEESYAANPRGVEPASRVEVAQDFLHWLTRGNFVFMGVKERVLDGTSGAIALVDRPGSALGILRSTEGKSRIQLSGDTLDRALFPRPVYITKANSRSTVARNDYLDYIGVRRFDMSGRVIGEYVILGLFTRQAYSLPAIETPLVRERIAMVRRRLGYHPGSYSDKALLGALEDYPRLELLQASVNELAETFSGIMGLEERRKTRLFLRADRFNRFITAVVYLPRDRYNTDVRYRIEQVFRQEFDLSAIDYEVYLSSSSLARLFFRIRLTNPNDVPTTDHQALEKQMQQVTRSWAEATAAAIEAWKPGAEGRRLASAWADASSAAYRADYTVEQAIEDIVILESLSGKKPAAIKVEAGEANTTRLKTYLSAPHTLTELLPVMQNMGLVVVDQKPYEFKPEDGEEYGYLYDFGVEFPEGVDPNAVASLYEDALNAYLLGERESDTLDRLILSEGLTWQEARLFRALNHYLIQLGLGYTPSFMSNTLLANPAITKHLVEFFNVSFDPNNGLNDEQRNARREDLEAALVEELNKIPTLDADRYLRSLSKVIRAILRTNAYLGREAFAIKVAPQQIDFAPLPRPKFEIFVYSPRVEGVHLRFGDVARGGLRWSDRRDDFRTEVLGLVKAQMVKNAVIIPTGAKGGFYPKQLPDPAVDRDAWITEGRESYKVFIRSLLDVTDNLAVGTDGSETVVRPEGVIARDENDYYLVVAADKGTAAFSDTANAISLERGFWLGDAFASGGSVGYDHKAMGITARGAWESVKRHFAELGHDAQTEAFTAVGIGDMSGDVFGNGLLRSKATRLVAAFDHRDIFLDPTPDAAVSFQERQRLYNLPRSSWQDYNRELISAGGGVYSRGLKSIEITPEVREVLGLDESVTELAPAELISAILKAPVDLIYNGGIGTYVKASTETNAQVGDKANDALRVNGKDLRARIVGEGGNLGFTQLGRIEAARNGVLLNTDAIDNSAGVETSDREVNIKILVDRLVARGELSSEERASFIESLQDEVGGKVLETNVDQNVLLQGEFHGSFLGTNLYKRLMHDLEEHAGLNRAVEFLPTDEELDERLETTGDRLTRPELAVLAAYVKIYLTHALEQTDFADDPYLEGVLRTYFPAALVERFGQHLDSHPLRKEIICTRVANELVNIGGITFAYRIMEEFNVGIDSVARAFIVARELFELGTAAKLHSELSPKTPLDAWFTVLRDNQRVLDRAVRWFITERGVVAGATISELLENFGSVVEMRRNLPEYLSDTSRARVRAKRDAGEAWGLPEELIVIWIRGFEGYALLDVIRSAADHDFEATSLAPVYFATYDRFKVDELLGLITELPRSDRWEILARQAMRGSLYETAASLALSVAEGTEGDFSTIDGAQKALAGWIENHPTRVGNIDRILDEIAEAAPDVTGHPRLAVVSVALRTLASAS
ncbi:NAD-glutamate dehydrogenase [Rothia mucilaginosa]|uniref:NAD-glutamate dehydrogenase n=1 Tax=Rothia mucilaginosa TaxID=43675 RepID=UPI0019592285|nr:NAD-glutamate dehydrogenase [Rothia mucilaginosa]VTY09258.1 NAD-specific glutamate dehydrogenase [Rothia mucilaginosa]